MPTSHKANNANLPIYITLRGPQDYYTSGNAVRGHVRVHPTERPNGIRIEFEGRCKMKITEGSGNNKRTFKSRIELFSTGALLFNSRTSGESYAIVNRGIEDDGKVALPFEFTFPTEVSVAPPAFYRPREGFEHEPGHPLPASLHSDENVVEYVLKVSVYKKVEWSPDMIITLALPFKPTGSLTSSSAIVRFPMYTTLSMRGHQLNPENPQNPGTLTKLKWSTLSKYQHAVPEASWKLTALCPYRLVVGKTIPISLSFTSLSRTPELPEDPVVYVRQIRVKLTSVLSIRIPYSGITGERDIVRDFETDIVNHAFSTRGRVLSDGLRLAEIGHLALPRNALPSFKTYGMRLRYRIKVVVDGDCTGKSFSRDALRDACEVVCERRQSQIDASIAAPLQSTAQATPVEETLPAYEPAPEYNETLPEPVHERSDQRSTEIS